MFNTGKFAQKTVVITGASRGIGKEIALKLAKDGANIVICAKTTEPHPKLPGTIYTTAEEVEKAGGKALACVVDVRDEKSATEAVESAVKKFGGIDILVNNASAISLTNTLDTPMKRYDLMQSINARGTFLMSQKCIPYLKSASNPHILNLSPPLTMDSKWFALHVAYTMSKYGMSMCVLGMHEELRQHGIAVNALWPRTAIWTSALEMISGGNSRAQNACRKPSIVADAAYAILSKNSRQYTGNFAIDEELLREEGVRDFDQYAYSPGSPLMTDFFLPGVEHPGMPREEKISEQRKKSRHAIKTADLATIINEIKSYITPELVKRISAVYEFTLTDGSDISNIYIDLKNENGAVMEGKPQASEVQFEMALSDFAEMFAGKLSSTEAFISKKLKVKGSMMKAMQLEGLLKEAVRSKSKL